MFYKKIREILPLRCDDVFYCYLWQSFSLVALIKVLKKHHHFPAPPIKHDCYINLNFHKAVWIGSVVSEIVLYFETALVTQTTERL